MANRTADRALDPLEMRFTDPDDVGKYGDGWFTYDESEWIRLPARELMALEREIGTPLVHVMNSFRSTSAFGETAAAWLAVRARDLARAGTFDEFTPHTFMIEWRSPEGKAPAAETAATPELLASDSQTTGTSNPTISETPPTVVLQTLPIAE